MARKLTAGAAAVLAACGLSGGASAQEPCGPKRCVAVPEVKKSPKVVYDCKSVDVCKTRCGCGLLAWLFGGCADCCGKPREKRSLLKFTETCERPGFKCVVEPGCPPRETPAPAK